MDDIAENLEESSQRKSRRREGRSELHTWLAEAAAYELKRLAAARCCSQRAMLEELIFQRSMVEQKGLRRRGRPRRNADVSAEQEPG